MKISALMIFYFVFLSHTPFSQERSTIDPMYSIGIRSSLVFNHGEGVAFGDTPTPSYFNRSLFFSNSFDFSMLNRAKTLELGLSVRMPSVKPVSDRITNRTEFDSGIKATVYPFRLTPFRFSPFLSYDFMPVYYRQVQNASEQSTTTLQNAIGLGVAYTNGLTSFKVGYHRIIHPQMDFAYYKGRRQTSSVPSHFLGFGLGLNVSSIKPPADARIKSDYVAYRYSQIRRSCFFLSLDYVEHLQLSNSSYISTNHPYFDQRKSPSPTVGLLLGTKWVNPGIAFGIRIKRYRQSRKSFDTTLDLRIGVVSMEINKEFPIKSTLRPYVGFGVGYYEVKSTLNDGQRGLVSKVSMSKFTPIFKMGYEIERNFMGGYWTFGSVLRVTPFLTTPLEGASLSLQHLEFSPIVLTFYPGKYVMYNRLLK